MTAKHKRCFVRPHKTEGMAQKDLYSLVSSVGTYSITECSMCDEANHSDIDASPCYQHDKYSTALDIFRGPPALSSAPSYGDSCDLLR